MPVVTRAMAEDMKKFLEGLSAQLQEMKAGQDEMKKGQDEMKEEVKKGQDEMKEEMKKNQEGIENVREEMKKNQEGIENVREEMKKGQDEMKEEMKKNQEKIENVREEMKKAQEQMKNVLDERFASVEKRVEEVDAAIADVRESTASVEKRVKEVDAAITVVKESTEDKIAELKTQIEESTASKIAELQTQIAESTLEKLRTEMEGRFQSGMSSNVQEHLSTPSQVNALIADVKKETSSNIPEQLTNSSHGDVVSLSPNSYGIKTSIYDGKTAWSVYKTQFDLIASANGWDEKIKAYHLAASLRGEAADILQTLPENRRADWFSLVSALELRFGEQHLKDYSKVQLKTRKQKSGETLQELAADIERLSLMAFPDCPPDVRDNLASDYFIDAIRDPELQETVRISGGKDLKSVLLFAIKVEAAHHASRRERRPVRAAIVKDSTEDMNRRLSKLEHLFQSMTQESGNQRRQTKITCWQCKKEGHLRRNCPERDEAPKERQLN